MRKLVILTAVTALGVLGLASPGAAYHGVDVADECGDASPGGVDISALSVLSRADPSGRDGAITVMIFLCAAPIGGASYRVHFDYKDDLASERNPSCVNTSDATSIHAIGPNGPKDSGPGTIRVIGSRIVYTVRYKDLDLIPGDELEVWADTRTEGIADRAPNTDGGDGCSKPQTQGEVLGIELVD